jgi:hypothetical protein
MFLNSTIIFYLDDIVNDITIFFNILVIVFFCYKDVMNIIQKFFVLNLNDLICCVYVLC